MDNNALVIIIDDNADNILAAELGLQHAGVLKFFGCASGYEFFRWWEEAPRGSVDLILLDLHMPDQDGYMVLKRIRDHPDLRRIRVAALTANATADTVARCQLAGFDAFIAKPLDPLKFPGYIQRIFDGESLWLPL